MKINKNLIKNNRYKDFNEILNEELNKLNEINKFWKYYLEIKKDYIWLYLKKYEWWIIYQSLAFFDDISIYNRIKWNINFNSFNN